MSMTLALVIQGEMVNEESDFTTCALEYHHSPGYMMVHGSIKNCHFFFFFCRHWFHAQFYYSGILKHLKLKLEPNISFDVMMENDKKLKCKYKCQGVNFYFKARSSIPSYT